MAVKLLIYLIAGLGAGVGHRFGRAFCRCGHFADADYVFKRACL